MKLFSTTLLILFFVITICACSPEKQAVFKPKEVYKSGKLVVTQVTENTFIHNSFIQTNDYGNVPCNGLIVRNNHELVIFDTPTDNAGSEELIKWIQDTLGCKINAVIPTHFHDDCLGGLKAFHNQQIPSYAYFKTIELAKANNRIVPLNSFDDSLILKAGDEIIIAKFFGEGHTKDNIVGYYPGEKILFGGCLLKELNAGKGYLGDVNVAEWSNTVEKVKKEYPDVKIVVPGHGAFGDKNLFDYTINLFRSQ